MSFLNSLDIAGSGLTAQKTRIDVLTQNLVNAETTRTEDGEPYRRKITIFQEKRAGRFGSYLNRALGESTPGVKVAAVIEDERPLKPVYDPEHPDADEDGYIWMPNVDAVKEMSDMLSATRAYQADVTAVNIIKTMASQALQIGK
ncbi:MAG: flagellar basal body rod protein FlgC [Gracilibacteraceae bacterium]|jgi:flagellar basal-body rod protein FlgC|nr:flagellar basal body rod protein FlgC [Gracilibacteraceae bacterium]